MLHDQVILLKKVKKSQKEEMKMKKIKSTLLIMLFISMTSISNAQDMIQIKGSDTLINLVQKLAEVYMQENPGKYISVSGGGSGTGVAGLINSKCDIADASRLMQDKEIKQAQALGVEPKRVVIAIDGLSIISNKNNPVKELTVDQVGKIFRGEVKNWNEIGGLNKPITLYGRQSNSGTFDFMVSEILKGDHASTMNRMNGNSQIVEAIEQDSSGIGYVGVGYAKEATGITVIRIATKAGGKYVSPLVFENVITGEYPISRPLNQYVNGAPKKNVRDFIDFELGIKGQQIVEEMGFFPIPQEYKDFNKQSLGN